MLPYNFAVTQGVEALAGSWLLLSGGGGAHLMIEWVGRKTIAGYAYLAALATLFIQAVLDLLSPGRQGRRETLRVLQQNSR